MKPLMVSVLLLVASSASAQTVSSTTATITIKGSGFQLGATVTQNGVACTISSNTTTQIVATCPSSGTIVVRNPAAPTYPFVLKSSWTAPSTGAFTWTVGTGAPAAQTLFVFDNSPCPPVPPVPYCAWPGTTVTSDSPWLVVSPASGTTAFNVSVSINTSKLTAGSFVGHITVTQKLFSTPTLSIPVTLTVAGGTAPSKVTMNWPASTVPAGGGPVTGYNVLRGTSSTGPFTQIATTTAASLTYVDGTPPAGSDCYVVQGVNSSGPSGNSPSACVTVPAAGVKSVSTKSKAISWGLVLATLAGIFGFAWRKLRKSQLGQ